MFPGSRLHTVPYDELRDATGAPRPAARALVEHLDSLGREDLLQRQEAAGLGIEVAGVSFTVYDEGLGIDRAWPFDVVPRVLDRSEWDRIEAGLLQRLTALNHFLADVYGKRQILEAGVVPADLILGSVNFREECDGIRPPHDLWAHICGSDLVRDADGTMYVLEDNLRVPSGVSYVLENRQMTKRVFGDLFERHSILPVDAYPDRLRRILASLSPVEDPVVAVLTPGIHNSAYFEHSFLARAMGVPLVEGRDMFVDEDDRLMLHTIDGPVRVDVLYRRVDDLFLDPEVFRSDSTLGTPGLMRAWAAGNVALANAPGGGVADDKVVYSFVPDMIRFYLGEDPILPNVPTFCCDRPDERAHVLANLERLVIKPANESGGYGIVVGPAATADELHSCAERIRSNPRNWVAQPVVSLSTVPTLCEGGVLEPRHVDLRPFSLLGGESYVTCGGLTRVARQRGSLIVNSSQGGGSKDTWVVDTVEHPDHIRIDAGAPR